ncbi:MAG: CocE/NonD family hydrolase [Proteobacteria bacterium]|nr:CocE/NonD family hydrolase [Pseudomonadota bacterium]
MRDVMEPPVPPRNFTLEWVAVPMRDGVTLCTAVLHPTETTDRLPVLLYRTPYKIELDSSIRDIRELRGPAGRELATDYIQVLQQVRGRCGSQGRLTLRQPLRGPFNTGLTDESTDSYDTVEWIVTNIERSNGRVGILGGSYSAWVALTASVDPHPALRAVIATAPEIDCWKGDDDFHNGAFRLGNSFEYVYGMETDPGGTFTHFPYQSPDLYDWWLARGSAVNVAAHFEPTSYFHRLIEHPAYDAFWSEQALDRRLARSPARPVPTMIVQCLFDSYDPYGAPAVFAATRARDIHREDVFVAGPWDHGQNNRDAGERLGPFQWNAPTAEFWRRDIARPFLDRHLRDPAPRDASVPPAQTQRIHIFDTGLGRWAQDEVFAASRHTPLFVAPAHQLEWQAPSDRGQYEYISDPANPVPFRAPPIAPFYRSSSGGFPAIGGPTPGFGEWLLDDQRFADGRPDVLSLVTQPLERPLTVRGRPTAVLRAVSSADDCDWVVKLIDAYPDEDLQSPPLSGYQLLVASEMLRGRYRNNLQYPTPIPIAMACEYRFELSYAAHTFRPGHRLMIHIQSSWFPLYDRNPQRYVSIMSAVPQDYERATQQILFGPQGTYLLLPELDVGPGFGESP